MTAGFGRGARLAAAAALSLLGAACGEAAGAARVPLRIHAASSLTEAFTDLEATFERDHPDVDVQLTFAGSQVLRLQIEAGAGADLFASANAAHARALTDAGLAGTPVPFAASELVLVVPPEDPAQLRTLEDLPRASRLVLAMPNVPAGAYADALLRSAGEAFGPEFSAGVERALVSREPNVRLVRAKVELGAADAALVYRTDALASEGVRSVVLPRRFQPEIRFVATAVGPRRDLAEAFLDHLLGDAGRGVLVAHGFQPLP